ncbi:MAG: hypothetical protein WBA89_16045 [Microcoleus sp.]|uniref:hypothetical protein n=1 Tax=Microcoleus sp. TaxID=44472 RepID=UPI003C787F28
MISEILTRSEYRNCAEFRAIITKNRAIEDCLKKYGPPTANISESLLRQRGRGSSRRADKTPKTDKFQKFGGF